MSATSRKRTRTWCSAPPRNAERNEEIVMPKSTRAEIFAATIENQSLGFRNYFSSLPALLTGPGANLPAALAYEFHLVETAHHRILYGCLCRIHDANSVLAKDAVNSQHMTRSKFGELFNNVVGQDIPVVTLQKRAAAEVLRDKMVHGKSASDADLWAAIQSLTGYAIELNAVVDAAAKFEAFGDMRGVVGRRGHTPLSKGTTRWLLKGMGFSIG